MRHCCLIFYRGNARADDLVRNNGVASNAVQLHQDHIVGNLFKLSYRPNWRYIGISREDARALARDVEVAWTEYAEDPHCTIDIERKRTFTMMIREGVATHAFNGENLRTTGVGELRRQRFSDAIQNGLTENEFEILATQLTLNFAAPVLISIKTGPRLGTG